MPLNFTPDQNGSTIQVPYFEDARADIAPGYAATKNATVLQSEITASIALLGGQGVILRPGTFGAGKDKRYGYRIDFSVNGYPSVMQAAALPMRTETVAKKAQALKQALWVMNMQLKAMITAQVFTPGYAPLVQFMLVPGTDKTVGEMVLIKNSVPNLNPSLPATIP